MKKRLLAMILCVLMAFSLLPLSALGAGAKVIIKTQPTDVTVIAGETATFRVVAVGASGYQWYYQKSGSSTWTAVSNNGTSDTYSLKTETRHNGYKYKCVLKAGTSTTETSVAKLTVNAAVKPTITTQPKSKTVNEGKTATFKVVATGAKSYQWYVSKNGGSSWSAVKNNGTSATYSLVTEARHSGYKYKCKVSNASGSTMSKVATLTVKPKPVITTQPTSKTVTVGQTATFKVVATGATGYQWYYQKSGESTWNAVKTNGTSASYSVTTETRHNGYKYKCAVKNSAGTVYSSVVTLTVTAVSKYRALLVGEEAFNPICTRNRGDVTLMANMLASVKGPNGGKYSVTKKYDLNNTNLKKAISTAFSGATKDDVSLFFIATHGDASSYGQSAGALSLIGSTYAERWILLNELASCLKAVPGKVIVVLESCGSGAAVYANGESAEINAEAMAANDAFTRQAIAAFAANDTKIETYDANTGEFRVSSKFYVLTASAYHQLSWGSEYYGYNYFTKWLTNGVGTSGKMPADTQYGGNSDGKLTLEELYKYISAVGDNYTFRSDGQYYTQQVKRYPENSTYKLFTR